MSYRTRFTHLAVLATLASYIVPDPAIAAQFKVMIATWRGCEDACMGVREHLVRSGLDIDIILRDADRNSSRIPTILAEARAEKVDVIVTWGTLVTLGIAGTLADRGGPAANEDISQVFMVVADPVGANLVESLERPGRPNLTGTYNRVPEEVNIATIRAYLPNFRRLGLLFNRNEPNSVLKREELAQLAVRLGFEMTAIELPLGEDGRPRVESIAPAMAELKAAGMDFVYPGSSSFLQANGAVLARAALEQRLPLFSPYEELVREAGALISVAARYSEIGRLAGQQVVRVLSRKIPPGGVPIAQMSEFAVVINLRTAQALGKYPPIGLLQIAETTN